MKISKEDYFNKLLETHTKREAKNTMKHLISKGIFSEKEPSRTLRCYK